jgi:hypothetical protein
MLWQAETRAAIHAPVARDKSATARLGLGGVAVGREALTIKSQKSPDPQATGKEIGDHSQLSGRV